MISRSTSSPTSGTTRPERGLLSSSATAATIRSTTRSPVVRRIAGYTPLSPQRPRLLEVPRQFGSPEKATLRLAVIDTLSRVQFSEPALDLRQDHQAFDGILQRGIRRQLLDRLEDLLFGAAV